jgi:membrane protease YdiL (CAAX protease family)
VKREWTGLVFAMTFPTVVAWTYFVALAGPSDSHSKESPTGRGNSPVQIVYSAGKILQFSFPVIFLYFVDPRSLQPSRLRFNGLDLGIGFGLSVGAGLFILYRAGLRSWLIEIGAAHQIRHKIEDFECGTPMRYLGLAIFLTVGHSLLEEYYWRWFVFGRLRRLLSLLLAITMSSLAFMAHHVIVLGRFFPNDFWNGTVPFSLGVAVGGGFWAWLYDRCGSIFSTWISHLLVDAAIFAIGYDLVFSS